MRKWGQLDIQTDGDAYTNANSNLQTSPEVTITKIIEDVFVGKNRPGAEADSDHENWNLTN